MSGNSFKSFLFCCIFLLICPLFVSFLLYLSINLPPICLFFFCLWGFSSSVCGCLLFFYGFFLFVSFLHPCGSFCLIVGSFCLSLISFYLSAIAFFSYVVTFCLSMGSFCLSVGFSLCLWFLSVCRWYLFFCGIFYLSVVSFCLSVLSRDFLLFHLSINLTFPFVGNTVFNGECSPHFCVIFKIKQFLL